MSAGRQSPWVLVTLIALLVTVCGFGLWAAWQILDRLDFT
jgi:hypothetical protein